MLTMKTLTLTLIILLITISGSISKPYYQNVGFSADLIEIDSPLSPLYNRTSTRLNRLQNAFLRSISRASLLSKRAGFTSKIEADLGGIEGAYIMTIKIGTPPVTVIGIADTGSDLTWAQCQPCKHCFKQTGPPILEPYSSSTYEPLTCQVQACTEGLSDDERSCDSENVCHYSVDYGGDGTGGYTKGDLVVDTFSIGQTQLKDVIFGCSHDTNEDFRSDVSGIIGLGGGTLSLINQLESVTKGKFSYCLIPYSDNNSEQTSKIHFGDNANVLGDNVVTTPLVRKYPSTYYYVTLESIFVDEEASHKQISSNKSVDVGNIIIDSGTTLTLLPEDFYIDLYSGLTEAIRANIKDYPHGFYELCYEDLSFEWVPLVIFRFTGADMFVPAENLFLEVVPGVSCLMVTRSKDSFPIIGNFLHRNMLMGFDLVNQQVKFRPADCTKNM